MSNTNYKEYGFADESESHMHKHFMPLVLKLAESFKPGTRVLDVGCGNGASCVEFQKLGCTVVGVDLSQQGIEIARRACPAGRFEVVAANEEILKNLNEPPFDIVISTEVVEHLYDPRAYARGCISALRDGGRFICTTPYHGYLKNLALSIAGKWDAHANPLWDGGHIKLWSRASLSSLLTETGFRNIQFRGAGRFPGLWMTMVMSGDKP